MMIEHTDDILRHRICAVEICFGRVYSIGLKAKICGIEVSDFLETVTALRGSGELDVCLDEMIQFMNPDLIREAQVYGDFTSALDYPKWTELVT